MRPRSLSVSPLEPNIISSEWATPPGRTRHPDNILPIVGNNQVGRERQAAQSSSLLKSRECPPFEKRSQMHHKRSNRCFNQVDPSVRLLLSSLTGVDVLVPSLQLWFGNRFLRILSQQQKKKKKGTR